MYKIQTNMYILQFCFAVLYCMYFIFARTCTAGIWIVSLQWVVDSLKQHAIQDESAYEVTSNAKAVVREAPRRAREARISAQVLHVCIICIYRYLNLIKFF